MNENPLDQMESGLDEAVRQNLHPRTTPHLIKPREVSNAVSEATNTDTDRTTRTMLEQLMKISEGIEHDIEEAKAVRETISQRIGDLNIALSANKAAIEVLSKK
jgi:hypothetical protein